MKYSIAYGRNLDLNKMKEKCPHCILVGQTYLYDWQLAFRKYITIEPCKGQKVPVGVFQIDEIAEKELDKVEDFPVMYRKEIVEIDLNGKKEKAIAYVINDTVAKYPDEAYLERVFNSYKFFNFDPKYITDAIERIKGK